MILGRQPTAIIVLALIVTTIQPSSITVQFRRIWSTDVIDNIPNPYVMDIENELLSTCYYQTLYYLNLREYDSLEITGDRKNDDSTCDFHFDFLYNVMAPNSQIINNVELLVVVGLDFNDVVWSCKLNKSEICNGFSECQTDECHCRKDQSDVFYCADGSGCTTMDKLCDDIQDCTDGSDECFCFQFVVLTSPEMTGKLCVSQEIYCQLHIPGPFNYSVEAGAHNCVHSSEQKNTPIYSCLINGFHDVNVDFSRSDTGVSDYCRANCSRVNEFNNGWEWFCNRIIVGTTPYFVHFEFRCNLSNFDSVDVQYICDGVIDCDSQADEIGCPGRFYCTPNTTADSLDLDKVCDNVKDCANGADECGTCQIEEVSSSEFLIKSKVVLIVTITMGILIVTMNIKEGYKCWTMSCTSKTKAIDNMFLLQIFCYDTLMGVYLCCIFIATIVLQFKGDYCLLEHEWRASLFCPLLGVLFSFSSHGSLIGIASVSITRFLTCRSLVVDIKKSAVIIGSTIMTFLNLLHSVIPLLPVTAIQDIFRSGMFFTHLDKNPFFGKNPINRSRLNEVYKGLLHRDDNDVYKMLRDLRNTTSRDDIFDITEITYYGNTGLCVHNIFKPQDSTKSTKSSTVQVSSSYSVLSASHTS